VNVSSGSGSPGQSRTNGRKTVVVVVATQLYENHISKVLQLEYHLRLSQMVCFGRSYIISY